MRPIHYALILIVALSLVYAEVPNLEFLDWDDQINVSANPWLNPVSASGLAHFWKAPYFGFYIPVTRTVWAGLAWVARTPPNEQGIRLDPTWFHVANLAVHVLNTLLALAILRLLIRADGPAFAGAALFALHPIQVEPVCWVTGMKDMLGAFFALCAIWQYLHYARAPASSRSRLALSMLLFTAAVLAKPTAVVAIAIAWVLDHFVVGRRARDAALSLVPWVPIAVGAAVLTKVFNGPDPEAVAIWARPLVAADALAFYLGKIAWPVGLCANYARKPALVLGNWWGYVTWLAPAAVAAALIVVRRRLPILTASGLVFGLALLPVLGLVPFNNPDVCDRFMYLAMLGPALALGWCVVRYQSPRVTAIVVLLLAGLAFGSSLQSLHWRNTGSLFTRVLAVNPRSWAAHTNMGKEVLRNGSPEAACGFLTQALKLKPEYAEAHDTLGAALFVMGRPDDAVVEYRRALSINPYRATTHHALGDVLATINRPEEAQAEYEETLRLDPQAWYAHDALGVLAGSLGRHEEAVRHFRECVRIKPDHASAHANLGFALLNLGREDEARRVLDQVRARWPHMNVASPPP